MSKMITKTLFSVSYCEIDKMHIVHHSNYPKWFEIGRKDYLHKVGISNSSINHQGFYLPLSEMKCKFKSPARYGDELIIFTGITFVSCSKIRFEYNVLNKRTGKSIASGYTIHAWTNRDIKPLNIEMAAPHIYTSLKALVEAEGIIDKKALVDIPKE